MPRPPTPDHPGHPDQTTQNTQITQTSRPVPPRSPKSDHQDWQSEKSHEVPDHPDHQDHPYSRPGLPWPIRPGVMRLAPGSAQMPQFPGPNRNFHIPNAEFEARSRLDTHPHPPRPRPCAPVCLPNRSSAPQAPGPPACPGLKPAMPPASRTQRAAGWHSKPEVLMMATSSIDFPSRRFRALITC